MRWKAGVVARWRDTAEVFPGPLAEFVEGEWGPVEGECLDWYACGFGQGGGECVPCPGEFCGQAHYAMLARDYGSGRLAAARRADAYWRFARARLAWLGEDHPDWLAEFFAGAAAAQRMRRAL